MFTDNLTVNTPTLLGATWQRRFFHDGRSGSLNEVIRAVLTNPAKLNSSYEQASARLSGGSDYQRWFWQFYRQTHSERAINNALIAYLRSLSPRLTTRCSGLPLSDSVRVGQAVFAQSGCKTCHSAPFCRNGQQHEVAAGRWVRTPTLRNLPLTPPYLADSSAPTLEDVQNTSFHARQRALSPVDVRRITPFLKPTEPVQ